MNLNALVSIVIPCYNADFFIEQTIQSIQSQTYTNIELIIVNDGSTDKTELLISKYLSDVRINYFFQNNAGVSTARNFGFDRSKGEFIVFLDADDIIESQFIQKRMLFMQNNPYYSACCSSVHFINQKGEPLPVWHIGVHDNILKQILSYAPAYSTCPSNYLFRRDILQNNDIHFNSHLSSSADRFFLLESCRYLKIGLLYSDHNARLLYRVHDTNMSRAISTSLLHDNYLFMQKVLQLNYIPNNYKIIFRFKVFYILSGGYFKLRNFPLALYYAIQAAFYNPLKFVKQLCAG